VEHGVAGFLRVELGGGDRAAFDGGARVLRNWLGTL
jgi:hypothetical protein